MDSTWDLIRSFAPRDNEDEPAGGFYRQMSYPIIDVTGSDTPNDEDEESFTAPAEHEYSLSSIGYFDSFKNWQKGNFLGSGSFGTVYEGFNEYVKFEYHVISSYIHKWTGNLFAVKEVSLLDQGSQGKQIIFQLEQEISLLSQFHHENIVRYLGTDTTRESGDRQSW
ncbi:hypothetical protein LXL04_020881 [Taraxacum kok-saghyz]